MQATWYLIYSFFCHFISLQFPRLMCFSPLNFLASKYCKYSPSIGVGDSHGMIFLGINCLPLLSELNNKKNKYRFNLFYYQRTLHREERGGYIPPALYYPILQSCHYLLTYLFLSSDHKQTEETFSYYFCIPSHKQCLVLRRSLNL